MRMAGKPPEAGRGKEELPLQVSEAAGPRQNLDCTLLLPRTVKEYIFVALSHPICANLLGQP